MRLKLSGPDYKDMDPVTAFEDFKRRVANYEKAYEAIGEYEEDVENLQYCKVFIFLSWFLD
jgi:6-phosphofructo-2-kinase